MQHSVQDQSPPVAIPEPTRILRPQAQVHRHNIARQQSRIVSLAHQHLALAAVLALSASLRLWNINSIGINTDEAVYAGQAAAIAGDAALKPFFPMLRAHPLLFQFLVSLGFLFGVNDLTGRVFAAGFGVGTVYLVYRLGTLLYGRRAGLLAGLFMAAMPYHVVVSRQLLLDGPMVFFATLSLCLLVQFALTRRARWLYLTGMGLGLTFLAKETGIIVVGAIYVFLALYPAIRVRIKDLVVSTVCMIMVMAAFPISAALAGGARSAQSYLIWQLLRRPNHTWSFYPSTVPIAIGPLLLVAAIVGLLFLRRENTWRELLLIAWIVVPTTFFQLWPVKGFQYLLPSAPAFVVLAGRTLSRWPALNRGWLRPLAIGTITLSLLVTSWQRLQPPAPGAILAGAGGIPGGREAGLWIKENLPEEAELLTVGPSMANILQFYGHRKAYGLSVSSNPLHRNPSYQPVPNPDRLLRNGELQYLVYDVYSAARSAHFADRLLAYARRYNGRVVHTESAKITTPEGATANKPLIIIYEVLP
jgi:hypothetical protein